MPVGKTFSVTLGGRERELKYTRADRLLLEERYGMGLFELVYERVMPTDANGKPTGGGQLGPQTAVVWAGLRHHGPKVSERQIGEWIDALVPERRSPFEIYATCIAAILASGCLGYCPAVDDESEPETEEGKGDMPQGSPEAS